MSKLENEKQDLSCPKCKRPISITLYDIINRREAKCSSCGSMLKFNSSNTSNLHSAISNIESAQNNLESANKKFTEAFNNVMSTADVVIKN